MLRLAAGTLLFLVTLALIMVRPRHMSEATAAAGGAALMLLGQFVSPTEALQALRSQWNVYGFFLGLMTISALADRAGIFVMLAHGIGHWANGSARRLYLAVFGAGSLITIFLSNDATALILTPVVYTLATGLRLPVLPFMFACTFIADTASFVLPVSNPINILVMNVFGGGLGPFLRHLLLPCLFAIGFNTLLFTWLFRRDLGIRYRLQDLPAATPPDRGFFRFTVGALVLIAVAYTAASALQVPLSFVALAGAALLLIGASRYEQLDWQALSKEISWSLFVFVSGMFILIRGVENLGLTAAFGRQLLGLAGTNPLKGVLLVAEGTALGSNMINNVPMALVMSSALASTNAAAGQPALVYATMLGADLGPNLTTVGSLATIVWVLILRRKGLEISTLEYFKLGVVFVPVIVTLGSVLIWLGL